MKKVGLVFLTLFLAGCVSSPRTKAPTSAVTLKACADQRPRVCTMDYQPVCGFNDAGKKLTSYSNACTACADPKVLGYTPGQCK